jgi:hypothetical protein
MRQFVPLQLIFIHVFNLFRLYAEIVQRLFLCAMVEADHETGKVDPEGDPLVVWYALIKQHYHN